MKHNALEFDIDRIGSQTARLTPEEEKALAEFFKNLKLQYQRESEAKQKLSSKDQAGK